MSTQLSVFIASSVDGYIATNDDKLDWLTSAGAEGEDYGYDRFIATVDAVAMGRGTFNYIEDFPTPLYDGRPLYVFTHNPPTGREDVIFWQKSPLEALAYWNEQGYSRVYIDGGQVISSFLAEGLIDDMLLTKVPLLLGDGKPLFNPIARRTDLELVNVESFPSGMLNMTYRRK